MHTRMPAASAAKVTTTPEYAFEGSVFIGGAVVQWLRDGLRAISSSSQVQSLAESVPDAGGVMFVPAFTGLATGVYRALEELSAQWQVERRFLPTMDRGRAQALMAQWEHAIRQAAAA